MKSYVVVVEPTSTGYSAYLPNLPGCITTGRTRKEVESNMREAIELHLEGLKLDGLPVPSSSELIFVDAAA